MALYVSAMIAENKARGAAIIGIFHDHAARDEICDHQFDVTAFTPGLAA
jgi:alpha-D-ribose 1-methylphosphonate 5-triphosphate synthase subunit PhnL